MAPAAKTLRTLSQTAVNCVSLLNVEVGGGEREREILSNRDRQIDCLILHPSEPQSRVI